MRGHPIAGGIGGFFFGVFVALLLQQFGIRSLNDPISFFGLPLLFLVVGLLLAWWAPFGRRSTEPEPPDTTA